MQNVSAPSLSGQTLRGPFPTFAEANAAVCALYRSGTLAATALRPDGWYAERVCDDEAERICEERHAARFAVAYVAEAPPLPAAA